MSLLRREPRPVYRVYAEEEYDGGTESVDGEAADDGYARDAGSFGAEAQTRSRMPTPTPGSLELRRRPLAFLVVGLLVLLAAVVVAIVLSVSNTSRRAPRRSVPAAPAVSTATAGHPLAAATPPMPKSTPPPPLRRSQRVRRPSATRKARTDGDAPASALEPVPAPVERPLLGPSAAPATAAEFGFER